MTIDPSWNGFALAVFIPVLELEKTKLYSLNDGSKGYMKPKKTIDTLHLLFCHMIYKNPEFKLCDHVIIEGQFKTNMKNLQWITMTFVRSFFPEARIECMSALKAKRIMGIELQESHWLNKKEAVNFIVTNQNLICAKHHYLNDNRADAIILLNAYLKNTKMSKRPWEKSQTSDLCNNCGQSLAMNTAGPNSQNPGRKFLSCSNRYDPACKKNFRWLDEPTKKQKVEPTPKVDAVMARLDSLEHLMQWIAEQLEKIVPQEEPITE